MKRWRKSGIVFALSLKLSLNTGKQTEINKFRKMKMKRQKRTLIHKRIKDLESAVRIYCYDHNGGMKKIDCDIPDCPLYPFRPFGKHSKKTNDEDS